MVLPLATWLYLIEILHQTTTSVAFAASLGRLYLIEILHQTTTPGMVGSLIVQLYLIEILHQTTTHGTVGLPIAPLYLIEILHQTTTSRLRRWHYARCILLKFYIKPQLLSDAVSLRLCCILLKFYIKPQLSMRMYVSIIVVSY